MNNIISHEEMIKQVECVLKSFYMIGFKEQDADEGKERFLEQMGYDRSTPMGDLSHCAKQAVVAINFLIEEAKSDSENEWWRVPELQYQIKYLEEVFIKPIEERKSGLAMLEEAIGKPKWLTLKIQAMVAELWRTPNVDGSNPRVQAIKLIQNQSENAGYKIGINIASQIIHQHCL